MVRWARSNRSDELADSGLSAFASISDLMTVLVSFLVVAISISVANEHVPLPPPTGKAVWGKTKDQFTGEQLEYRVKAAWRNVFESIPQAHESARSVSFDMPEVVLYRSGSAKFREAVSRAEKAIMLARRTDWSGDQFDVGCPLDIVATASVTADSLTQSLSEGMQSAMDELDKFCQRSFHFELPFDIRPRRRPGVRLTVSFTLSKRTLSMLQERYSKGPEADGRLLCR